MIDSQMLKGVIEGVILQLISEKPSYGYDLVERLKSQGFYTMTESTVYPVLNRLLKKGDLLSSTEKSKIGPRRKYYYITEAGKRNLESFKENYRQLDQAVRRVID